MFLLFALYTMMGWAVGDILVAKVSRKLGNIQGFFWWQVACSAIGALYIPFAGPITDWPMFILATLMGLASSYPTLLYFRALEIGNVSLVGTICGSYALVTVPLSIILFHEHLTLIQGLGIVLIIIGLILASLKFSEIKTLQFKQIISDPGVRLSFLVMIIWGVFWCLIRIPVEKIGWFWAGYPGYFFFVLLLLMKKVQNISIKPLIRYRLLPIILIMSTLTLTANFSLNHGLMLGYSSIVTPIAGSYPILFVIISRFVFKEPLTKQQVHGIILSLVGIVTVAR